LTGTFSGVNTLLLAASTTPVADIVALAVTPSSDGIVSIPGVTGTGLLAVATVNVGAPARITAVADTGSGGIATLTSAAAALPVSVTLCQTNSATGACLGAPAPTVTVQIDSGQTPTFAVFVAANGTGIPFDPAKNRVFVRFKDENGVTRGSTSVAVRTK
jgi:hypothetical protein